MSQERKKILYVITKSNFGGAQRYVYDLATSLPPDEYAVAVALGGTGEKGAETGALDARLQSQGIRTHLIGGFMRDVSPLRDTQAFFELVSLFRKERPDVVHLNSAKAVTIGALAARVARVPRIVSTIHGWASNEPRPLWQRLIIRGLEIIGVVLAHATIVVAHADARRGTVVIHNGIAPSPLLSRAEARKALNLPPDDMIVGSIGELTKNKNYETLILALDPGYTIAIIGDGEERASLSKNSMSTMLLGYVKDAARYLLAFDVFVLPSQKEGLPYVLLEAGLAGLPVIASRVGGIPEIIDDGISGTLISPHSTSEIYEAVESYAKDEARRKEHGERLKQKVTQAFSLSHMQNATLSVYKK